MAKGKSNKMKLTRIVISTVLIILLFSLPFIIKSQWFLWKSDIDSERLSQYGSYIGGLLGASFAGLSLFIIILTYRHQLETSYSSKENEDLAYIHKLHEAILVDLESLTYGQYKGTEVLFNLEPDFIKKSQNVLDQVNSLLCSFEHLILIAKNTKYSSEDIQRITLTRIYFLYYSKLLWPIHAVIWTKMKDSLSELHDDAKFYFPRYQSLSKESIDYLTEQKLIAANKKHF